MTDISNATESQWAEARQRAAVRFGVNSIPYNSTLNGSYDSGNLVKEKLVEVMKESLGELGQKD